MSKTRYANAVIPPTVGLAGASLLHTCDPTLEGLLAAFKGILRAKLDPAWAMAAQGISRHVVMDTYAYDPLPEEALRTWQWPALALYRTDEDWTQQTMGHDSVKSTLRGLYILPPMTCEVMSKLSHIRPAVTRTLRAFIEHHGDKLYNSGEDFLSTLNIQELWLTHAEFSTVPSQARLELAHPAIDMTFLLKELSEPVNDTDAMTEIASNIAIAQSGSPAVEHVVDTSLDPRA